jgi:transcriptional regulator with XRE-family HTH domain
MHAGDLIREWRQRRRLSQLDLAIAANVSSRHLSFVETGRSRPTSEMILHLAEHLDVPLRDRNALLQAAGFAPAYRETALTDPAMADIRQALELILSQHEPFGAIAMDGGWNIVMANQAYTRFLSALAPGMKLPPPMTFAAPPRVNAMRLLFEQDGLRQHLVNWPQVARELLARLSREAAGADQRAGALLQEPLRTPGVPGDWREPELDAPLSLVLPVAVALGDFTARFFTTLTTLGAPQDVTLQELRIESFHAADAATAQMIRAMAQA